MQETVALAAVDKKEAEILSGSDPHGSLPQCYEDVNKRRTDPTQTLTSSTVLEKDQLAKRTSKVQQSEIKRKVEYGRVQTRHVNQLFIRGENVLLVNMQQD